MLVQIQLPKVRAMKRSESPKIARNFLISPEWADVLAVRRGAIRKLRIKLTVVTTLSLTNLAAVAAFASPAYRIGAAIGYGGSGIMQAVTVEGTATVVERSEGPGMLAFFADRFISDYFSLGLEHSRGFSLAPFSMGSSFTGLAGRWYFWGPAATVASEAEGQTQLLVKRLTPFFGLAVGVAAAEIKRENDAVPSVSGSGAYTGLRIGADYPLAPGIGIRPEINFSSTFYQNPAAPATLSEFALQIGLYWFL